MAVPPGHELVNPENPKKNLNKHRLLLLEEGHCLRDQSLEICRLNGIREEQDFKATLETLRQMVKAETGITFMPKIAIQENELGIRYIPFKPPTPSRKIGLCKPARYQAINKLITIFKVEKNRKNN